VYGSQAELVDEHCIDLQPQSPYAACKIAEETLLKDFFTRGLKGVICRLGTIYGTSPGMRFHTAVNKFCWQAVMGQEVTVWETAMDQKRPYLALSDATEAFGWILKSRLYDGGVYNLVSGNHTVREVIAAIQHHIPSLNVSLVSHAIMNQLSYEVCATKFSRTGFDFKGDLRQGIKETLALIGHAHSRQMDIA
jgi:nucleoside-diphosphate-sugar epimerase